MSGTDAEGGTTSHANMLFHYTFDTPVAVGDAGAAQYCGHVIFSDFHVSSASGATYGRARSSPPSAWSTRTPTRLHGRGAVPADAAGEGPRVHDLGPRPVRVRTPTPPNCTPLTCQQQGFNCGPAGDGCGNEISAAPAPLPTRAAAGARPACAALPRAEPAPARPAHSRTSTAAPRATAAATCSSAGPAPLPRPAAAAGSPASAATPTPGRASRSAARSRTSSADLPATAAVTRSRRAAPARRRRRCGGGGVPGQCGAPDAGQGCQPSSCSAQGLQCGTASDGCGNALNCGSCPAGQQCNASGKCVGSQ